MPLVLSDADQRALARAMVTALSPFEHPSAAGWRLAVCRAVADATGVAGCAITMPETGRHVTQGIGWWPDAAARDYAQVHHQRTAIERRRRVARLRTWTRTALTAGDDFIGTSYYNDWCLPHRVLDSAGMSAPLARRSGGEATCHVVSELSGSFEPGGREESLLRLLQPAFTAGARLAVAAATWQDEVARGIDRTGQPMSLHDTRGRLVHATPALLRLACGQDAVLIAAAAEHLARDVGALLTGPLHAGSVPLRSLTTRGAHLDLSATLVRTGELISAAPLVLISVSTRTDAAPLSPEQLRARFRLTAREAEVALLLADGRRNHEIAAALGTGAHTARRHTEHVLDKLGVHSRAGVASAIRP